MGRGGGGGCEVGEEEEDEGKERRRGAFFFNFGILQWYGIPKSDLYNNNKCMVPYHFSMSISKNQKEKEKELIICLLGHCVNVSI